MVVLCVCVGGGGTHMQWYSAVCVWEGVHTCSGIVLSVCGRGYTHAVVVLSVCAGGGGTHMQW